MQPSESHLTFEPTLEPSLAAPSAVVVRWGREVGGKIQMLPEICPAEPFPPGMVVFKSEGTT